MVHQFCITWHIILIFLKSLVYELRVTTVYCIAKPPMYLPHNQQHTSYRTKQKFGIGTTYTLTHWSVFIRCAYKGVGTETLKSISLWQCFLKSALSYKLCHRQPLPGSDLHTLCLTYLQAQGLLVLLRFVSVLGSLGYVQHHYQRSLQCRTWNHKWGWSHCTLILSMK